MNKNCYRVVFNRARGAFMVVQENGSSERAAGTAQTSNASAASPALRLTWQPLAFVAALFFGLPQLSFSQILPSGAGTQVIQTQNGLPQVNIARPSGAGVSVNNYSQFDVQKPGAILNNSPVLVNTQQAGYINGNPNFGAGQSARIIVNQVNSANPSQLRGYVEVAGNRAQVVLANPSGIVVDGGGFINTSRATLTTGTPFYGADGSLAGYNVSRGLISVQGAGLNAANVDQVDLISRAVQANAAIYANNLNVIAGANQVNHETLAATPIAGDGAAPAIAIDVSQLGGMYANRVFLVSNEFGVGVANAGTIAAQAGDLTLQSNGQLISTGKTNASGNLIASAAGVQNSGTTYAQQNLSLSTGGALSNTGTLAAQQNTTIKAGSVNSSGTLGAGVNNDGTVGNSGDLNLSSGGQLTATGQNVAGGNASISGGSLNLAGSQTAANGSLALNANDLNLANATTSAKGSTTIRAASIDNHGGSVTAGGALSAVTSGALNNAGGTISGSATTVAAASIDNGNGSIDGDTLSVSTAGDLINRNGKLTQYGQVDQVISAGGALDNTGGKIATNATNLTMGAQSITNGRGTIQHAGVGVLAVNAAGGTSNASGTLGTNGALQMEAASLNNASGTVSAQGAAKIDAADGIVNSGGTLYAGGALDATTQGDIDNTGGSIQSASDLSVTAGGKLSNAHATLSANGAHGALIASASNVDNSGGKLTNAGDGATTINSGSAITNTGGTLGGNGNVTLNAQTLTNDAGAKLVAGGAANLNVTQSVNNANGTIFGGTALTLNQSGAAVVNDGGSLLGGNDVSLGVASLSNSGGAISANRDIAASGIISGDGAMTAGRDLALRVDGDYSNGAANKLHADRNMSVVATGTLTNSGTLAAVGGLTASGANVVNTAGADINSSSTTVTATNALTNAGRIEGDTVTTNSATLANKGTVIGNDVTVNSADVQNTGAAAVIAGANSVKIYASNSVTNSDGALIYSAGNLEIAKDGTRDTSDMLANQTGKLTNSAASIEADGDIDIAAHTVNNLRTGVVTQAGTPVDSGTQTLTLWTADLPIGEETRAHYSLSFPQWTWGIDQADMKAAIVGKLAQPISVTVPKSQVTNLDPTAQTLSLATPVVEKYVDCTNGMFCSLMGPVQTRTVTNNPTQYYQSVQDNGDSYTITFWPDFDPNKNIRPDQVKVRTDLGSDSHDYSELSRTTTTTTATDQLVNAGNAAKIQAQGAIRINSDGGSINNESSTMAAGGDLVRRATGGTVNDTGTVLQQTVTENSSSTFYWHQKTGDSQDTKTVADGISQSTTTLNALPAIASSNQNVQTDAQSITVGSVTREGQTVTGSGVTGGSADGVHLGGVNGKPMQAGIPNLKLPTNGLYSLHTAPGATYLVATDPRFTNYTKFISSDYMLGQLGLNPQKVEKRLGDGLYEERLVRDQITQLTGRTFLNGYSDNLDEYTALMNNGVAYAKEFGLVPGITLTPEQMAQLTTDMVWLVSEDVTLPDGSHQSVLVPQVYLAQANTVDLTSTGALVTGNSVNLNSTGDVNNSGHIVSNVATTVLGNNVLNSGVIGSSGTTAVAAVQDARNSNGRIGGNSVIVQAGRDVINETTTYTVSKDLNSDSLTSRVTGTGVTAVGTISSTNNMSVSAGRDVTVTGAQVQAGGDATIAAARDINVSTTTLTSTQDVGTKDGLNGGHDKVTQNLGSSITTGGNLVTVSGRDTTLTDATVSAGGNATIIATNNLTVTAAKDTHEHSEQSMGGDLAHYKKSSYDESVQGSNITSGGNATLAAGQGGKGNLSIFGSNVSTDATGTGGVILASTGDITIGAVNEKHDSESWSHTNRSGFLSHDTTTDTASSHEVVANGSTVSGDTVTANSGNNLTVIGSTVAATHDVTLAAANDLTITTSQDTSQSTQFHEETHSGLGSSGGAGISYGNVDDKTTKHQSSVSNNGSMVGSTDGSLHLSANSGDLHVTGSQLVAAKDITGTGVNVTIDAATDTNHEDQTHEYSKSGFTLAVKAPVIDAVMNAVDQAKAASNSKNDRAAALHSIAAASSASDALGGGQSATSAIAKGDKPEVSVELSYGSSHSKETSSEDSTTHVASSVQAGATAAFVATGNGVPGSGNLSVIGSGVTANDVILDAKNQVNLLHSTDTDSTRSTNESSSASVGVSYGTNGFGVSASMSKAHGDSNSDAVMQNNTHVTGTNSVTINSGGDTNIISSNVSANKVSVDVGGSLNIASVQDTTVSKAHQESTGGGFSISQGGGSASFSHTNANANGNYAQVNEQAGIQAGDGGFQINVKDNTNLTAATIASTADASKNTLTTGTLTYSDMQNHSDYSASSSGFSAGTSGFTPMLPQNDSGSSSSTTKSAISPGTINITDKAHQTQDISNLSRDTSNTNQTVSKLPDLNNILSNQADMMAAVQAAGQAVAKQIGAYADAQYKEAKAKGDQAGIDAWKEGGADRAMMQAGGFAIIAALGGGNAIGAAAGAGLSSLAAGNLNKLSDAITDSNPTGNPTLNKALASMVATAVTNAIGFAAGGSSGAFSADNVDQFNRQLHPDERQWAKDNASKFAQVYKDQTGQTITADQAQQMLLASGYRLVDAAASAGPAPEGNQYATAFISQNGGSMFRAAPTEYNSPFLYGKADHSLSPEQQALPGHDAHPQVGVAAGGALAMVAVGTVSPLLAGAWALNTAYDFSGDAISYLTHTSSDAPNAGKSLIVGGAAAALTPLGLPLDTLGSSIGAKIAVGTYNGLVSATGAFAGGGMVNPSSDPSASAATSATAYGVGTAAQIWLPGLTGNIANHVVQILSGPAQTKVQNSLNNPNSSK